VNSLSIVVASFRLRADVKDHGDDRCERQGPWSDRRVHWSRSTSTPAAVTVAIQATGSTPRPNWTPWRVHDRAGARERRWGQHGRLERRKPGAADGRARPRQAGREHISIKPDLWASSPQQPCPAAGSPDHRGGRSTSTSRYRPSISSCSPARTSPRSHVGVRHDGGLRYGRRSRSPWATWVRQDGSDLCHGLAELNSDPSSRMPVVSGPFGLQDSDANTVDVVQGLQAKLASCQRKARLQCHRRRCRASSSISRQPGREGILGALFAIITIFIFLMSLASTLVPRSAYRSRS